SWCCCASATGCACPWSRSTSASTSPTLSWSAMASTTTTSTATCPTLRCSSLEASPVRKVLFVIPSLEYGGAARQLTLLAAGLPRAAVVARVCVLGSAGPWADDLRTAGVDVTVLGWDRPVDPRPLLRLRHLLAEFRPDVVHAWQRPALPAGGPLRPGGAGPVLARRPLRPA